MYNCISSCLLFTAKTSPHPSYDIAYFKVTLLCCFSYYAIKKHTQISLFLCILTYRFLLCPVRPNCTSPVETLSFSCVSPSLLRPPGIFCHFIPITLGGCLPSVSTYLICKLLFHFAFTKENMDLSNSTELGSE